MFRPAMSEPVMKLWGEADRPKGWSAEQFATFCEIATIKHAHRMSVEEIKTWPVELRLAAIECARTTLRNNWGYALCEENRFDDPAKWKQPYRDFVITCAREIEANE